MNKLISNVEIAKQIENIFNNNNFIELFNKSNTIDEKLHTYSTLPTILIYYYIITNDTNYDELIKKYNNDSIFSFYKKEIKNKIDFLNIDLNKVISKIEDVYKLCSSNRFYTHSFSGALYNSINEKGININDELFKNEYSILNEIIPNKEHKITYNELSPNTFDNALYSPRRLTNMFKYNLSLSNSMYDSLKQGIVNKILDINKPNSDYYYQILNRLLDNYYKQNTLCIAIFRKENVLKSNSVYIRKIFLEKITKYQEVLKNNIKKYKKEYDKIRYIDECTKPLNVKIDMLNEYIKELYLNNIELRYNIEEYISNIISDIIVNYCMLNNISNHETSNIIPRSSIAIAKINNIFN